MTHFRLIAAVIFVCPIFLMGINRACGATPATAPTVPISTSTPSLSPRLAASPINHSPLDDEPIRHSSGGAGANAPPPVSQDLGLSRVGASLAIVIVLILLLRWGGRKLFGSTGMGQSTRAVQLLSRSPLSPRQSILVVRVGRRIIVVGDSGAQMNALSEITDPDEVASLLGQLRDDQPGYSASAFGKFFQRASHEMHVGEHESADLRDESPDTADAGPDDAIDPAIHETREELTGLMEKIRSLSHNFPSRSGKDT